MNIFFADISEDQAILSEDESWHCVKVLRKKAGDEIVVIDGKGKKASGKITIANSKNCIIHLDKVEFSDTNRPYGLHLAIAPTKNIDRIEWFIEKAVEIGIDEITFLKCKNSERTVVKLDRIRKIVESAVKQSLQMYMPKINDVVDFDDFVKNNQTEVKMIAHCEEGGKKNFKKVIQKHQNHVLLIGPEGDFTLKEIELAFKHEFIPVTLGEHRLRTETAALYACNALSVLLAL